MSNNLIITSGASQLLTQITALRSNGYHLSQFDAIYIGDEQTRLSHVLIEICKSFRIEFITSIDNLENPTNYHGKRKSLNYLKYLMNKSSQLRKDIFVKSPVLENYQNMIVSIPLRHKMIGDALLIHALSPKKLILTADGVVNEPRIRNLTGMEWWFMNNALAKVPANYKIYAPTYLKKEINKIGSYTGLPDDLIKDSFSIAAKSDFFQIAKKTIEDQKFKTVLFSQHLSRSNFCNLDQEINFYISVIEEMIQTNKVPILIKTHPREETQKIEELRRSIEKFDDHVFLMPDEWTAFPHELFDISDSVTTYVTVNSSAPLTTLDSVVEIICFQSDSFREHINTQIEMFAQLNNCILKRI